MVSVARVAPLAGSVDRNPELSAGAVQAVTVAPLAGSVDRNKIRALSQEENERSLPSRGAWIEIRRHSTVISRWQSRSPRGERG